MYRPTSGTGCAVWVALARVHWEWGLWAQNNNQQGGLPANWVPVAYPGVPAPTELNPIGPHNSDEFFPAWDYRSKDLLEYEHPSIPGYPGWYPVQ